MDLSPSPTEEHLASRASGPIVPLFKKLWRYASFISTNSLSRSLFIIHALLLWFLLLISPRQRLPHSASSSSLVSVVLKPSCWRLVSRRYEEDTLRRRSLAQGLEVVSDPVTVGSITSLFFGPRCNALFFRAWFPVSSHIRGILIVIHGLNEHSGRYSHFAHQLTACNFGVYAMDWIGHGGSDGLHGYVPCLDHVVADTGAFLEKVKSENPGIPCFFFGHSTGGAIVLKAALCPHIEKMLDGVLLTSPALRVNPAHPIVKAVAPIFSLIIPTFQIKGANTRGIPVSRDPAALQAKYSDPLVYTGPIRVRTGYEILRMSSHLLQNFKSVTVPFLVLHGTSDRVTDPLASLDLYREAASEFKDIKLYDGFLHDLLFEPEREEIGRDIINWMETRLAASNCLQTSQGIRWQEQSV